MVPEAEGEGDDEAGGDEPNASWFPELLPRPSLPPDAGVSN